MGGAELQRNQRLDELGTETAERIVERLRYGLPPVRFVRAFTVGREDQLHVLERTLAATSESGSALLINAEWGAGKSHLLQVIREMALEAGYAVSLVVVNAQEGVRFNRMDTIMGAVCRELEVDSSGRKGVGTLFDAFRAAEGLEADEIHRMRDRISNRGKWDQSDYLKAPAIYVALRAWVMDGRPPLKELLTDWLGNPFNFRGQQTMLRERLVTSLRSRFWDPRPGWVFSANKVFLFHPSGHRQAWNALADLDLIAKASGLRGLVLLFDEFEDVIENLKRRDYQQQAFFNLFRFFAGNAYPGMSYFAVTPGFAARCKSELVMRGLYDFDYTLFDRLPTFKLDQILLYDFWMLAERIRLVHGIAYEWDTVGSFPDGALREAATRLWSAIPTPDRVRRSIQALVKAFDDKLGESR